MQNSILKATKREQALKRISQHSRLSDVYRLEEKLIENIINRALNCADAGRHWHNYESLKTTMSQFVGWNARHSELRTNWHYEAMIDFIDWLLVLSRKAIVVELDREVQESKETA